MRWAEPNDCKHHGFSTEDGNRLVDDSRPSFALSFGPRAGLAQRRHGRNSGEQQLVETSGLGKNPDWRKVQRGALSALSEMTFGLGSALWGREV